MSFRFGQSLYDAWRLALIRAQCRHGANPVAECHHWLGKPGPACPEVCIVMMIKDEADIIYENLAWHRRLGFSRFIVLDNGSTDNSRTKLLSFRARWPDAEVYIVDDPSIAFFQDRKITGLACMAEKLWPSVRWIFPLDADEFICVRDDLADVICRLGKARATIAYIPYYNYHDLMDGGDYDDSVPFYRHQICHRPHVEDFKVTFRALGIQEVENGSHDVEFQSGRRWLANGLSAGIVIRHFPARSVAHLRRKIINGGRALAATDYPETIGWHWRNWYRRYQAEGDAAIRAIYDEMRIGSLEAIHSPFPLDTLIQWP